MRKGIFLFIMSSIMLGCLIGAGITLWGNENIRNQERTAAENLEARKSVVEVNSQLHSGKTFTVTTGGEEHRIIRFIAEDNIIDLDTLVTSVTSDKRLLQLLKQVGFKEIQISSPDQSMIVYVDLVNNTVGKKSNT